MMSSCRWRVCRLLLCGLLGCCLSLPAVAAARPEEKAKAAQEMSPEAMMAEYMKYANPGPQHEALKPLVGSWKTVTKAWMAPGQEPQVTEGTSEATLILGGRFIKEEFHSTFMNAPFQGFGITGYDLTKGAYVGSWTDTMGTGIMNMTGEADSSGKVFNWTASYYDPVMKQDKKYRMVTKIVDNNSHTFQLYEVMGSQETLGMEITYTRR